MTRNDKGRTPGTDATPKQLSADESTTSALPTLASDMLRVGGGYSVRFTTGPHGFAVEWHPAMPRDLRKINLRRYTRARNDFLQELAAVMGRPVAVVEVTP